MQDLLDLALDDPNAARERIADLVVDDHDDLTNSYLQHALGIALREQGALGAAADALRVGLRFARRSGEADRERDIRSTLATVLAITGRSSAALRQFDLALSGASGELRTKIEMRHAGVLAMLGRHSEALAAMTRVADAFRTAGNSLWEARSLVWLAHLHLRAGLVDAAERSVSRAIAVLDTTSQTTDRLAALVNLAQISVYRGDVALALRRYSEAVDAYRVAAQPLTSDCVRLFAAAYLSAGLPRSALDLLDGHDPSAWPLEEAEHLLTRANASLALQHWTTARDDAEKATHLFRRQHRPWFELRARLASVRAQAEIVETDALVEQARFVAAELHAERADEAPSALTLVARLARTDDGGQLLLTASSYRSHPGALVRSAAWLARALEREAEDERAAALRACRAGLDAIDEQRRLLGSSELRAQATTHGRELTEVALRIAASEPRRLLRWTERTRATTLAQPRMTSDVATIPESLAALRDNGRQLAEARAAGEPTEKLERERLRLERAVRAESHTVSGTASNERSFDVEEIVAGVGDGCLVEIVDVDGVLHVLVVHNGRVRRRIAGTAADAAALLDPVAMLLRRSARGRPTNTQELGRRLQEVILGDAVRLIPDGPVVLAPTTHLHGLPWSVLPVLADRPFSVVPSAGQWLRARGVRRPDDRRTLLVAGPGLASGGAEVPLLAKAHPDAVLLDGRQASLEAVLGGIDGADLVHLAAHGHFRADSPLFSSLDLADGPLTVHDIERIGQAPYRVVLSACESGVLAPVGAQELLGLAAALFSLGTAGLVCSVAEVNDDATADLMVGLHASLAQDEDPATALWKVRRDATDPVAAGTAAAFVALGV